MGPMLVEEDPYAYVVGNEHTVTVCAHCMRSSKRPLSRCSRCQFVHYCDTQCQKGGWPVHKEECLFLVKVQPRVPTSMARLLARVIMKRNQKDIIRAFNGRTFDSLLSHSEEIKKDGEKSEFFVTLSHVLFEYMGADYLPPASELLTIFGKVMVNVFTISNDDLNTIGLGLYLGLSVLDHSCDPDAFVLFNGTKAILRPLKQHITAYDSNEKTARSVRCRRCVDGYCPLDVNDNSLVCWQCGATSEVRVDDAVHLMQQLEWEVKRLQEQRNDSICTAKDLYNEASITLSSLNIPLCQLADRIASWAIDNGNFSLAADYIEKTIPCFKRFYPLAHPSLSLQYFKAGKLHSLSDLTLDLAAERLEQAVGCLHASHGVQHALSAQAHELLCKVQQQRRDLNNQRLRLLD